MDAAEDVVVKFPIKTKLVCSSCGAPGEGSCRCGAPYITPGERAEAAVKANPGKSDRAIAEELGVNHATVSRARKKTTVADATVEKRTGRDGRARKLPKQPKADKVRQVVADLVAAGKSVSRKKVGEQFGVGDHAVQLAIAQERAKYEILEALDIDPTTLAPSAQAKLEIAKRAIERKLNAEHAARMRAIDEEVRLRVVAEGKEYIERMERLEAKAWQDEKHWREMIQNHKPLFTIEQFKVILMCLHPDGERTANKLASAFRLFNSKKLQLTGEK